MKLLIATKNSGKRREFAQLLAASSIRLHDLTEFPHVSEIAETGATFAENSSLKAAGYALQTSMHTLADDSGLEVDALNGAPGVYSARYAGAQATDAERVALLLSQLASLTDDERRARFTCAISISDARGRILHTSIGHCEGRIALHPVGANGFGYDPIFIPEGYAQTFGELPEAIKQSISHRARALADAREFLRALL